MSLQQRNADVVEGLIRKLQARDDLSQVEIAALHDVVDRVESFPADSILVAEGTPLRHSQLLVSGRAYCDFVSYWPKLPLFVIRVQRDDAYIATLTQELADFNGELDAIVAKYQGGLP